jgi:ceroid-lipofuscinosis MFS transporter 7
LRVGNFYFIYNSYHAFLCLAYTPTTVTSTRTTTSLLSTTTAEAGDKGCPLNYQWCYTVPRVQLWQYITASIVITTGFSITNVICYSIFSKKLGDRPQGTMMGIFTSAGSLARAFGPIAVGFLYKNWGPRPMMIFMLVFVFSSILALIFNYKRLDIEPEVPDDISDDEESHINSNGTIAE